MTTFDKREEGFEKKFALDQEQDFKAHARRNRASRPPSSSVRPRLNNSRSQPSSNSRPHRSSRPAASSRS